MNVAASGSLVFCTSQRNHAKHKEKISQAQFKRIQDLKTWRLVRLWPMVFFRRKNMMGKYNALSHRDKITQTVIV